MKFLAFLFTLLLSFATIAQRSPGYLNLEGTVLGYEYDPGKGIFKKGSIEIHGSVAGVNMEVTSNGSKVTSTKTGVGGEYALKLELGKKYLLTYTKSDYAKSAITLDLTGIDESLVEVGLVLDHVELILNEFKSKAAIDNGSSFGTVKFNNSSSKFYFVPTEFSKKERLFKNIEDSAPVDLITNSLNKNASKNVDIEVDDEGNEVVKNNTKKKNNYTTDDTEDVIETIDESTTLGNFEKVKIKAFKSLEGLTFTDITNREQELKNAWDQLEKDKSFAVTEEDFLMIKAREELLLAAERELDAAHKYIDEQNAKLSAQQNVIYLGIVLILALLIVGFLVFKSARDKKKANLILAAKNKKINDSILYAERIQKSILLAPEMMNAFLPNPVLFYKPLDIVSGDFYWVNKIGDKIIFAAIDCTGHGVPGAFMSLIGNTLMNQIIKEKKITEPDKILSELHKGVVEALHEVNHEDDLSDDGMDMAICVLNDSTLKLDFAGAMNPAYIVRNGEVIELDAKLQGIGGTVRNRIKKEVDFNLESFQLEKSDGVYLFSDGYMDQFGGTTDEKFNLGRFKSLLLELQSIPLDQRYNKLETTFNNWKGNREQIDDVLVIGVEI
ncbi:MAG: SpoIIE family protein phosphatase [Crocinitomicaceae bacterium]|nr:SpoIIE family protein phosphatase [Crocinitomicaceae bacterium]